MPHTIKKTSELRRGDIVLTHGMRCLIDGDMKLSRVHSDDRGGVHYYPALVLNRDEVPSHHVPLSWTRDWRRDGKPNGEHRWTIQGNDLATWAVEA